MSLRPRVVIVCVCRGLRDVAVVVGQRWGKVRRRRGAGRKKISWMAVIGSGFGQMAIQMLRQKTVGGRVIF